MLQKLSYLSLILAIAYLLIYLKSGTFNSTAGIFMVIVFSWLCLRSYQLDDYKWKVWHYLTGLWSIYFVGTIIYGAVFILSSAIEYSFISNDTTIYLIISFAFAITVIVHFVIYLLKSFNKLKS